MASKKAWRIVPRPLLETILNNHAQHHRVPQPLLLHGPRGVGKTTLILQRLLPDWNKGPHLTGYVDFAEQMKVDHGPSHGPWASWSTCPPPLLSDCRKILEHCLESMAEKGVRAGSISSQQIFTTLNKWHALTTALRQVLQSKSRASDRASPAVLWDRAVLAMSGQCTGAEVGRILGFGEKKNGLSFEEASYMKESIAALKLAKKVIELQQGWKANAISHMNHTGVFSRTLTHSCTDWPCLLLELLSQAAEIDHFQPKLVINNIEVLKHATVNNKLSVSGPLYHDSLIWRIIALGANERCLPVILVTSDSYYSYEAFLEFGYMQIFISRETFGWTPQEAKMHVVTDYFSLSEWNVIAEVLGPNPRHLFELYALKQSNYHLKQTKDTTSTFEDIVDAYIAYLQITVVNPAMDRALELLQKFAVDVHNGKISEDRLRFGAAWRHPPQIDDPMLHKEWAKLQLMDFVQSFANTGFANKLYRKESFLIFSQILIIPLSTIFAISALAFGLGFVVNIMLYHRVNEGLTFDNIGIVLRYLYYKKVNYRIDYSEEIFDDPSMAALLQVGLFYAQRDPPFIRPISKGIQRCLVRWLVQQRMQLNTHNLIHFMWHRIIRGRYYRHLMVQIGYK